MRLFSAILLAAIVGTGMGVGSAFWRTGWLARSETPATDHPAEETPPPTGEAQAAVDQEIFDFGWMDQAEERTHDFKVTNRGSAPLTLETGTTSCTCTVSSIDRNKLPPGESGKITVSWKSKRNNGPYEQTVTIRTNDPNRPELVLKIKGEITQAVMADPAELIFPHLAENQKASGEVRLLSSVSGEPIKVNRYQMSDLESAKFFDVELTPLSAEEVHKTRAAQSGVLMRVTVKPGLPHGAFHQTILLSTNLRAAPEVVVSIRGLVGSEITIAGPDWDTDSGVLNVGAVNGRLGTERKLVVVVRGLEGKEVKFKPLRSDPDFLQVTVGETTMGSSGQVSQTPLTVRIPPRTAPASHLGSEQGKLGQILLEASHPRIHQVRIRVRFAIEEGS